MFVPTLGLGSCSNYNMLKLTASVADAQEVSWVPDPGSGPALYPVGIPETETV